MITSDYLEQIVDFDQPILLVGPGADIIYEDCGYAAIPMDRALIYFAEKLHNNKGHLDIFDLPPDSYGGGHHNIDQIKKYINNLKEKTNLGKINYVEGDIAVDKLPEKKYGFIWDHGTLSFWVGEDPDSEETSTSLQNERIENTIKNYSSSLRDDGVIAIATKKDKTSIITNHLLPNLKIKQIKIEEDKYKTRLNAQTIFSAIYGDKYEDHFGNDQPAKEYSYLYEKGFLIPTYFEEVIIELKKR